MGTTQPRHQWADQTIEARETGACSGIRSWNAFVAVLIRSCFPPQRPAGVYLFVVRGRRQRHEERVVHLLARPHAAFRDIFLSDLEMILLAIHGTRLVGTRSLSRSLASSFLATRRRLAVRPWPVPCYLRLHDPTAP